MDQQSINQVMQRIAEIAKQTDTVVERSISDMHQAVRDAQRCLSNSGDNWEPQSEVTALILKNDIDSAYYARKLSTEELLGVIEELPAMTATRATVIDIAESLFSRAPFDSRTIEALIKLLLQIDPGEGPSLFEVELHKSILEKAIEATPMTEDRAAKRRIHLLSSICISLADESSSYSVNQ